MARDKYEISIWEDRIVSANGSVPEHYEEFKVAIIGSDTMTSSCRAYEPRLVENINGTNTLTFKMFYTYTDEQTGEKKTNPFINLLVNERKIKAKWKNKRLSNGEKKDQWYHLVIKNIQEDSNGKSITYTCKDQFITELSKTGFELEFDNELGNNQGDVVTLGHAIIDGSGWRIKDENCDNIQQLIDEPVYVAKTSRDITGVKNDSKTTDPDNPVTVEIEADSTVYIFHSEVSADNKPTTIQFLWDPKEAPETEQNSQLLKNIDCYSLTGVTWSESTDTGEKWIISKDGNQIIHNITSISDEYRGSRLVRKQESIFDPMTQRYVQKYEAKGSGEGFSKNDIIYGYTTTEFKNVVSVNNLIVNGNNFSDSNGWQCEDNNVTFQYLLYPKYTSTTQIQNYNPSSYLRIPQAKLLYNATLRESKNYLPDGIQKGEKYIFRFQLFGGNEENPNTTRITTGQIVPHIYKYTTINSIVTTDDFIKRNSSSNKDGWYEYECECVKSFSREQITAWPEKSGNSTTYYNLGLFLEIKGSATSYYWLKDIQFFPLYKNGNERINPGQSGQNLLNYTCYKYYNYTTAKNQNLTEISNYLWSSDEPWSIVGENKTICPVINEKFTKIRSITASKSNRFNLLQTLAETFECWVNFEINCDDTGRPIYDDANGRYPGVAQKYIYFTADKGQFTGINFVYGIDLKTISRTIQSDQIVTKTIVTQNSNEFGKNGFCTIARSEENYPRTNFIYDFGYYISHNLINAGVLNKDLYSQFNGNITKGYYSQLHEINLNYDSLIEEVAAKRLEQLKQNKFKDTYENKISTLAEEINNIKNKIMKLANATKWESSTYDSSGKATDKNSAEYLLQHGAETMKEIPPLLNALTIAQSNKSTYETMVSGINSLLNSLASYLNTAETQQKDYLTQLNNLNTAFYNKYSSFIQEGSWIDESYMDDDLYYLDAQSVAYTSSRPQISYNISVARISSIEEFKNKVFYLGDITSIEDTEFFGYKWVAVNDTYVRTPYREQVLISEITSNFDAPEQDSFKIQNYKTQFEDLFQRITATTQSLQYASGEYQKAANIIDNNGNIKIETLQNSIAYNNNLLIASDNELIIQDSTGITLTDGDNPNHKTRITSSGIFISIDGGETWRNALRGTGISADYITSGALNTNQISILDGQFPTFRWDSKGLNAYSPVANGMGIDFSRVVRFDHFGIYGINAAVEDGALFTPANEEEIWDTAKFGMTWKGFFLHNKDTHHMVSISSDNDIQILYRSNENTPWNSTSGIIDRIKIGKLSESSEIYGIRFKDATGETTLETIDNGTLWLKDKLYIGKTIDQIYQIGIGYLPLISTSEEQVKINTKYVKQLKWNSELELWERTYWDGEYELNLDLCRIEYIPTPSQPSSGSPTEYNYDEEDNYNEFISHRIIDIGGHTLVENNQTINKPSNFVVWEDGTVYANNGYFEGTVNATSGTFTGEIRAEMGYFNGIVAEKAVISEKAKIGETTIGSLVKVMDEVPRIEIVAQQGTTFKTKDGNHTPTSLQFTLEYSGFGNPTTFKKQYVTWKGSIDLVNWTTLATNQTSYTLSYNTFNPNSTNTSGSYCVMVQYNDGVSQDLTKYLAVTEVDTTFDGDVNGIYYLIETQPTQLYKYIDSDDNISFTNQQILFSAYKHGTTTEQINIIEPNGPGTGQGSSGDNYYTRLSLLNTGLFQDEDGRDLWHDAFNNLWLCYNSWQIEGQTLGIADWNLTYYQNDGFNSIYYDVSTLFQNYQKLRESDQQRFSSTLKDFIKILQNESNLTFVLKLYNSPQYTINTQRAFALFNVCWGTSKEMAKFEVTATAINQAVADSKMSFSGDGLTITNGGLIINDANGNPLLSYNNENTGLIIQGNGSFTGNIYAEGGYFRGDITGANGTFSGTISAHDGEIGGFKITQDSIVSNHTTNEQPSISLNGETGKIIAMDIELGNSAKVLNFLKLGEGDNSGFIFNTDWVQGKANEFIDVDFGVSTNQGKGDGKDYFFSVNHNSIYLTGSGIFQAGRIIIDGPRSTITGNASTTTSSGFGFPDFEINPDKAYFPNVEIAGKITASVFEVGKTQAVGGMMLFKPSFKVKNMEFIEFSGKPRVKLTLEETLGVVKSYVSIQGTVTTNEFFSVIDQSGQEILQSVAIITHLNSEDSEEYNNEPCQLSFTGLDPQTLVEDIHHLFEGKTPVMVVLLGAENDMIIGVNSSNLPNAYMRPRGISMTLFKSGDHFVGDTVLKPCLFLGDLSQSGIDLVGVKDNDLKYGLYANNVILNGSITTQNWSGSNSSNWYYAGINTLSDVTANIFEEKTTLFKDTSKIVFWGGASDTSTLAIQGAPFQVTEKGSVYAQRGLFEGVIISRSELRAPNIYGARLHGAAHDRDLVEDETNNYSLAIYDTTDSTGGIVFRREGQSTNEFTIKTSGFYQQEKQFIKILSSAPWEELYGWTETANSVPSVFFIGKGAAFVDFYSKNSIRTHGLIDTTLTFSGHTYRTYISINDSADGNYIFTSVDGAYQNGIRLLKHDGTNNFEIFTHRSIAMTFESNRVYNRRDLFETAVDFKLGNLLYEKVSNGYNLYFE